MAGAGAAVLPQALALALLLAGAMGVLTVFVCKQPTGQLNHDKGMILMLTALEQLPNPAVLSKLRPIQSMTLYVSTHRTGMRWRCIT